MTTTKQATYEYKAATRYAKKIRNLAKKEYALALIQARKTGAQAPQPPSGLSVMAEQSVRLMLATFVIEEWAADQYTIDGDLRTV